MSEIKFEECSLQNATHVEVNGQSYFLGSGKVLLAYDEDDRIGISIVDACAFIPVDAFPILGIKPLKEKKRKPIEFEATFAKHNGKWHPLYSLDEAFAYQRDKKAKFKCVEILEEENE